MYHPRDDRGFRGSLVDVRTAPRRKFPSTPPGPGEARGAHRGVVGAVYTWWVVEGFVFPDSWAAVTDGARLPSLTVRGPATGPGAGGRGLGVRGRGLGLPGGGGAGGGRGGSRAKCAVGSQDV